MINSVSYMTKEITPNLELGFGDIIAFFDCQPTFPQIEFLFLQCMKLLVLILHSRKEEAVLFLSFVFFLEATAEQTKLFPRPPSLSSPPGSLRLT